MSEAPDQPSVVLAVRSDSFAGVERYLCDVANEIHRRGWRVAVVGGDAPAMLDLLDAGVTFKPAVTTVEVTRALVRTGHADVVHVHMTAAEVAATAAMPLTRRRFVTTRHFAGRRGTSAAGRVLSPVVRLAARRQIAISQFVAESLGEPSVVVHNGVPVRDSAPLTAARVTMMQRLTPEKDPLTGVRAWARSGLQDLGWRLAVAGRGSMDTEVRRLAQELGVADSVEALGFVVDTATLLESTSILLATAPAEPFGLSVLEAMSRGIPVIAADGGAHRETVGDASPLFGPGDDVACASALRDLASDPELRRVTGRQLQARQRRLFTVESHVDQLLRVYSSINNGRRPT